MKMRSPADIELVRRDAGLPGLGHLLDPLALEAAIEECGGDGPGRLELMYLRYKPGTNCLAAYRRPGSEGGPVLYAKAHGADAAIKLEKAAQDRPRTAGGLLPRILLPSLGVVVHSFPDDAKLSVLARLAVPAERSRLLGRALGRSLPEEAIDLEALAYKPERRYVARVRSTEPGEGDVVLKFHLAERHLRAREAARTFETREVLVVPPCRRGSKRHRITAHGWLGGVALRRSIDEAVGPPSLARVGAALAELHSQDGGALRPRRRGARAAALRPLADTLGFLVPTLRDRAIRLAGCLAARGAERERSGTPIHGDFYDKQAIVMDDRVGIVDLDDAVLGDAGEDLGLFIAHLERDRLLGRPLESFDELVGTLLEGYQRTAGRSVDSTRDFVAEGLLRLAHHPFRLNRPDWARETEEIVKRVEELIASPGGLR